MEISFIRTNCCRENFSSHTPNTNWPVSQPSDGFKSQGLSLKRVKFCLWGRRPLAVTAHFGAALAELRFSEWKESKNRNPTPRGAACLLLWIFLSAVCLRQRHRDTVGNTNQPTQADSEESDCQAAPPPHSSPWSRYNTQMDCHIRFRCIGYYTLGLLFPTQPSGWRDPVWGLSLLVLYPLVQLPDVVVWKGKKNYRWH